MKYGLLDRDIKYIIESIKTFSEITEVILFGSRAKGSSKMDQMWTWPLWEKM
ncbi:DNA polymerase beta domain [Candidatus Scalindua japonica]|uniref:DNA polymerase beta domain n=1 Tax=Candidatus Scalindua japonica TaxID=1284222 RepID=A0A286TZK1_9BACT|nr:DNA polymerase beta domain [Candidatus Scalindua japonica]